MAFGFGFNKQKVLSAAEKFVQQGKLPNAISEYEKILKHDAKDLTVMNTVGDLYSRLGETDKAAECFKSVGDAYAAQGFTVKAIAMYKKLSKIKASMECVLRLAELYTQQGLFNDARAQYLQVADEFLKTGQLDQAVKIFEKTLEMDPDNVAMRAKLAEVYIKLGKKPEAWTLLTAAAEALRSKGQLAAADEILQRMLKIEPGNSYALMLRGKAALDAGDAKAAVESLSKIADLDSNPEALRALFQADLRTRNFTEAGTLAAKLASVHDDGAAINEYANALIEAQQYREALKAYEQHSDRLLRNDPAKLIEALRPLIGHVKDDTEALEAVLALEQKAGETTHVTEIYELLAHAYVQSEELEKARDYYLKLMQLEPANQMHARNYQQVLEKLGTSSSTSHLITVEEGVVLVDELEATVPFIDQHYDDETALAVRSAMTDAELFISYNMPAKALGPLVAALPKAPRDLRLNQKLAALHTRAGRFAEAAICCHTLQSIYHDAGHAEEAARYGDLATKYEERSGSAAPAPETHAANVQPAAPIVEATTTATGEFEISAPSVVPEGEIAAIPAAVATPVPSPKPTAPSQKPGKSGLFFHASPTAPSAQPAAQVAPPAMPEAAAEAPVHQAGEFAVSGESPEPAIDLSNEWEQDLTVETANTEEVAEPGEIMTQADTPESSVQDPHYAPEAVSPAALAEGMEEVRFYLGQGMAEQAEQALAKLEAMAPGSPELAVLRLGVESARQSVLTQPEMEVPIEEPEALESVEKESVAAPQPWPQQAFTPVAQESHRPVLEEIVSEIEHSLGGGFPTASAPEEMTAQPAHTVVEPEPVAEVASAASNEFRSGTLDEFVSDLEASLGSDFLPGSDPARHAEGAPAPVVQSMPVVSRLEIPAMPASIHSETPAAMAAAASVTPAAQPMPMPRLTTPARVPESQPVFAADAQSVATPGVDLSDMFGDLKQELEEGGTSADEDPETHYNLGVAFREMGLLDEAIGEFQKVCQAAEHGHPFSQLMQAYTWLAQCFLDKGVPEAAVRWYERALKLPNLDAETRTALHYELASSLENAGNKPAALSNFLEVYGSNIEYRDVSERIKALRT